MTKLYITDLSLYVLLMFYLPLVLFGLWRIVRSTALGKGTKAVLIPVFLLIAYAIPLGDVTVHSLAMTKVCPQAGLHVYKKVMMAGNIGWPSVALDAYLFNAGNGQGEIYDQDSGAEASIGVLGEEVNRNNIHLHRGSMIFDFGDGDSLHFMAFDDVDPLGKSLVSAFQFAEAINARFIQMLRTTEESGCSPRRTQWEMAA